MTIAAVSLPFQGVPLGWQILFVGAFAVICAMLAWTAALFVRGRIWQRTEPDPDPIAADGKLWVFLVPALNEEAVIADSIGRLLAVRALHKRILVINDGSDDGTAAVLAGLPSRDLLVLERTAPDARQGKAAALNGAYRLVPRIAADAGFAPEDVIVCVIDADGRLDPDAPAAVAAHFTDERTGGCQLLVRIYNRRHLLTWMQDIEFSVYGLLYQAGRSGWGSAGMGGNGQFNRLSALQDIDDGPGPWHDRLTEDQDLGLRLLQAGWLGRQELRACVHQQGLRSLRRLYRQRARWAQGNLQAISHLPAVRRARGLSLPARLDLGAYLLMPFWQAGVGAALIGAVWLTATGQAGFWLGGPWLQLAFFYALGFGGVILGCMARGSRHGLRGMAAGFLIANVYAFYSWMLWPVLVRAAARQALHRRGWAKTEREAIGEVPAPPPDASSAARPGEGSGKARHR